MKIIPSHLTLSRYIKYICELTKERKAPLLLYFRNSAKANPLLMPFSKPPDGFEPFFSPENLFIHRKERRERRRRGFCPFLFVAAGMNYYLISGGLEAPVINSTNLSRPLS